ncbi:hypothetical protein LINPERPRIM_LOCUS39743 [Linum perenne]
MGPFKFKSQTHFVASSDGTTLQVYELTESAITHPSSIQPKTHLKEVANIHPHPNIRTIMTHTGLLFPNGQGRIEGREALATLAQHLSQLRLLVNPNGYCLQDVIQLRMYTEFNIHYLRLNDLFQWSQYGAETSRWAQFDWKRTEFNHHRGGGPSSRPMSRYKVMSKVEHDKWERDMRESKEKMEKQRRKMEKKGSEFERRLKEKDDEMESTKHDLKRVSEKQDLLEKKESELERLKKEKEEAGEYLKSLKQTVNYARSYLPEPAVVVDNVKKTATVAGNVASAAGSAAYAAGKATAQTAAAVGSYLYKYTPAARAEAERQRKMYKELNKRVRVYPPPKR